MADDRNIILIQDLSSLDFTCTANGLRVNWSLVDNLDGSFSLVDGANNVISTVLKADITDNGDGTFTFTNNDGSDVVFDANSVVNQAPGNTDADVANGDANTIGEHISAGGTSTNINETVTSFTDNGDNTQTYTSEDGTEFCVPSCIEYTVTAVDDTITMANCDLITGNVSSNDTICNEGNTIFKFISGSDVNSDYVVLGQGGEFILKPTDCTNPSQFTYCAICADGTQSCATVNIEYLVDTADAVDDSTSGRKGEPIVGTVVFNDTPCAITDTTYQLNTPSMDGVVQQSSDGSFVFFPVLGFTGTTTYTYDILCNGIVTDTATVTIVVVDASADDDFLTGLYNTPINGINATSNDSPCTAPSVTTYQWNAGTSTGFGGTVTGTPDNFNYTPASGFSGTDFIQYDILCDGLVFDTATVFINISVANPNPDSVIGEIDTPSNGTVSTNDLNCTGGATTSYHLVSDDTVNGSGLSEPTDQTDVLVTSWDTSNGNYTITPSNGFTGTAKFEYFIRCTNVLGDTQDFGPTEVEFTIDNAQIVGAITGTNTVGSFESATFDASTKDTTGDMSFGINARYDDGTPLCPGSKLIIDIEGTRDLDLQSATWSSITTGVEIDIDSGSIVDPSSIFLNHFAAETTITNLSAADLLVGNTSITLSKKSWADNNNYWDGTSWVIAGSSPNGNPLSNHYVHDPSFISGTEYASQAVALRFTISVMDCNSSLLVIDQVVFERFTRLYAGSARHITDDGVRVQIQHRSENSMTPISISGTVANASAPINWGVSSGPFNDTWYMERGQFGTSYSAGAQNVTLVWDNGMENYKTMWLYDSEGDLDQLWIGTEVSLTQEWDYVQSLESSQPLTWNIYHAIYDEDEIAAPAGWINSEYITPNGSTPITFNESGGTSDNMNSFIPYTFPNIGYRGDFIVNSQSSISGAFVITSQYNAEINFSY